MDNALTDFTWPSSVDYPTLNAVAAADPEDAVQENDERNNLFHKTMRVNCQMNIKALSNQHLVIGIIKHANSFNFRLQ
ncbi:MAG: hypothetical protein R6U68_02290 [Desulfobacteraceae bacterium]